MATDPCAHAPPEKKSKQQKHQQVPESQRSSAMGCPDNGIHHRTEENILTELIYG